MNKIPFDISFKERIERGKVKVVTRDNREVTIIKWDLKGNYPIVACVKVEVCNYEGDESWFEERPYAFSKEGKRYKGFPEDKSDIFILVEEPVSEELEVAAKRYATEGDEISGLHIIDEQVDAFVTGANWQKEQMMKDAYDAYVSYIRDSSEAVVYLKNTSITMPCYFPNKDLEEGDKVKILIVKSE